MFTMLSVHVLYGSCRCCIGAAADTGCCCCCRRRHHLCCCHCAPSAAAITIAAAAATRNVGFVLYHFGIGTCFGYLSCPGRPRTFRQCDNTAGRLHHSLPCLCCSHASADVDSRWMLQLLRIPMHVSYFAQVLPHDHATWVRLGHANGSALLQYLCKFAMIEMQYTSINIIFNAGTLRCIRSARGWNRGLQSLLLPCWWLGLCAGGAVSEVCPVLV